MKAIFIFIVVVIAVSCHVNRDRFQPIANRIKEKLMTEIPEVKNIDTLYLLIKPNTARDRMILQSIEYTWASTEAKRSGDADSSILSSQSDKFFDAAFYEDSISVIYYEAAFKAIFTKNDAAKGMAETRYFFDPKFKIIPKYSLIRKIAKTDNLQISIDLYKPFTPEEYNTIAENKILKYY